MSESGSDHSSKPSSLSIRFRSKESILVDTILVSPSDIVRGRYNEAEASGMTMGGG